MKNLFKDEQFLEDLVKLNITDINAFSDMIVELMKKYPEMAKVDTSTPEEKSRALDKILVNLEKREKYEDCSFITELKQKINGSEEE